MTNRTKQAGETIDIRPALKIVFGYGEDETLPKEFSARRQFVSPPTRPTDKEWIKLSTLEDQAGFVLEVTHTDGSVEVFSPFELSVNGQPIIETDQAEREQSRKISYYVGLLAARRIRME